MDVARLLNDLFAFLIELAMLALFAIGGFRMVEGPLGLVLALALPAIAIGVWSVYLAPRSKQRLAQPALAAVKIVLFIAAAIFGSKWNGTFALYFLGMGILSALLEAILGNSAVAARSRRDSISTS